MTDSIVDRINAAITMLEHAKRARRQGDTKMTRHDVKAATELLVRALYETGETA